MLRIGLDNGRKAAVKFDGFVDYGQEHPLERDAKVYIELDGFFTRSSNFINLYFFW